MTSRKDAKAQREFRKDLDHLLALEDQQTALRRKIKRLRRIEEIHVSNFGKPGCSHVRAAVRCDREASKLESESFSLGVRIQQFEKWMVQNYR